MKKETKIRLTVGILIFLAVFLVYLRTMAPTTSFWDCGEFIAVSYILGIPHPPGYPLFTLIGRIATLIPTSKEIAYRVNLLSPLFSSATIVLVYLLVVKLITLWRGSPKNWMELLIRHISGVVAGFLIAFSTTYWDNSIETEVYAIAVFVMLFTFWLTLRWQENREEKGAPKLLLLCIFLFGACVGIHLTTLLIAPALLLFVLLVDWRTVINRSLLGALTKLFLIIFLYDQVLGRLYPSLGTNHPWWVWIGPLLLIVALLIDWKILVNFGLFDIAFLLFFLGLSVHAYLFIRAQFNPPINECDPSTWQNLLYVLERKQYEPFNFMQRKADWGYQFGHMYLRYLGQQWKVNPLFLPKGLGILITVFLYFLGALGAFIHLMKEKKTFALQATVFILSSLGLVVYLNMANPQVRERDYVFSPSFLFFAMWMGIGSYQIMEWFFGKVKKLRIPLSLALLVILVFLSTLPAFTFYHIKNRSGNWIPTDYGRNILESCEPNGIIFTNGDNDTFPLWFVQQVKGIRKDVKVVNLSLLNTSWYMKQLKKAGVPFNFSEKQMDNLVPFRTRDGRIFNINTLGVRDIIAANAGYGLEMILEPDSTWNKKIFTNYKEKYPIYFAVTVSEDNLMGVQPHLKLEGLAFKVVPEIANKNPDIERTQRNLHQVYSYTGLFDPKVYKDDNTMKLISNYASAFWQVGRALRQKGDLEGAIREFEVAKKISPDEPANLNWLGVTYAELGRFDEAIKNLKELVRLEPQNPICYAQLAAVLQNAGQLDEAISWLEKSIEVNPNFAEGYGRLFNLHLIMGDTLKAISTLEEWVARHPTDSRAKANLEQLRRKLAKGDTTKILGKYRILEIGH